MGRRRTLENLFVRFERTLDGVLFVDEKNSAGNHCVFVGQRFKHSLNLTFLNTSSWGHDLKD